MPKLKPEDCPICKDIPPFCSAFYKPGRGIDEGMIPPAASKLDIIGYPYFKESSYGSNRHIRSCPHCGSVYAWSFTYEFLVEGSEDSYELERLEPAEGRRRMDAALAEVRDAQAAFEATAGPQVEWMASGTPDLEFRTRFPGYIWEKAHIAGLDLGFALPGLVRILETHAHNGKCEICNYLEKALADFAGRSESNRLRLQSLMSTAKLVHCDASIQRLTS